MARDPLARVRELAGGRAARHRHGHGRHSALDARDRRRVRRRGRRRAGLAHGCRAAGSARGRAPRRCGTRFVRDRSMSIALLAGPPRRSGMEGLAAHQRRLGALPPAHRTLIDAIERSDLRGKGGAGFPVATKWRAVASQRAGTPVVLANGGEGEPLHRKDRMLMEQRPHLVIDGALLAAGAVGADEIVLYVGADHAGAIQAMHRAITERPAIRARTAPPRQRPGALRLRRGDGRRALRQRGHRAAHIDPAASVRARHRWPANARAERRDARARRAHRTFRRRVVSLARSRRLPRARRWSPSAVRCHRRVLIEIPQGHRAGRRRQRRRRSHLGQ